MRLLRVLFSVMLLCLFSSCSHTKNFVTSSDDGYYPLPGAKVISPYKNNRGSHRHTGVDLKTKPNDTIYAVFDGVVTMSKSYYGYGKCIIIKHTDGTETLYSHNSKNYVKEGEKVKGGQFISIYLINFAPKFQTFGLWPIYFLIKTLLILCRKDCFCWLLRR